jgi:uncharacterized protein (DUF2062 family)
LSVHGETVLVVIPSYNHHSTLRAVVEKTLRIHPWVLVVDDGSTILCAEAVGDLVEVVRLGHNQGKGAAILAGADAARQKGMTHIITLDADGQHDPGEIPLFLAVLEEEPMAVLVGKRQWQGDDVPRSSKFGRSFSNFWFRVQTGKKVGDSQSGFRAYPVAVLDNLKLTEKRYSFEVEVLVKASWSGVAIRDIPVAVYYPPKKERVSHFCKLMDNARLSLLNTKLTIRSMLPWPHNKIISSTTGEESEKISVIHPFRSLRTLLEQEVSPWRLALAGALGVFIGTFPLVGFRTVLILMAASFLRLNKLAAVGASQLCAPPLMPALCIEVGYYMRHGEFLVEVSWETLGAQGLERLWEWVLGSLIVSPLMSLIVLVVIFVLALSIKRQMHWIRSHVR